MSALLTMAAVSMCVSTARMAATIAYAIKVSFFIATGNNAEVNYEKMEYKYAGMSLNFLFCDLQRLRVT